jgi:subtilisin family serine protease
VGYVKNLKNLKLRIFPLLGAVFLALALAGSAFAAVSDYYVEGEAIVLLKHNQLTRGASLNSNAGAVMRGYAQRVASGVGATIVTTYNALSTPSEGVFAFVRSDKDTTANLIKKLESDENVISAAPNYIFRSYAEPNDTLYKSGQLWGMDRINAPAAWDVTMGDNGGGQYVVVMDTGIKANHEDLTVNFADQYSKNFTTDMFTNDPIVPDYFYDDRQGHGTHVSGTVGAVGNNDKGVVGVNWKTKIIAVKVLELDEYTGNGVGTGDAIIAGLNYIKELIDDDLDIVAVNMSLGGFGSIDDENDPYYVAFDKVSEAGAVLVVAAGNDGREVGVPLTFTSEDGEETFELYDVPAAFQDIANKIA